MPRGKAQIGRKTRAATRTANTRASTARSTTTRAKTQRTSTSRSTTTTARSKTQRAPTARPASKPVKRTHPPYRVHRTIKGKRQGPFLVPITINESRTTNANRKRDLITFHILYVGPNGVLTPNEVHTTEASTPAAAARKAITKQVRLFPRGQINDFATATRVRYQGQGIVDMDSRVGWQIKIWRGQYIPGPSTFSRQYTYKTGPKAGQTVTTNLRGGKPRTELRDTFSVPFSDLKRAVKAVHALKSGRVSKAQMRRAFMSERSYKNLCAAVPDVCASSKSRAGGTVRYDVDHDDYFDARMGGGGADEFYEYRRHGGACPYASGDDDDDDDDDTEPYNGEFRRYGGLNTNDMGSMAHHPRPQQQQQPIYRQRPF